MQGRSHSDVHTGMFMQGYPYSFAPRDVQKDALLNRDVHKDAPRDVHRDAIFLKL